jgi:hypothetical protein
MIARQRLKALIREAAPVVLLLAIAVSYLLVWLHADHAHPLGLCSDECAVCSWAKSLAVSGCAEPAVVAVYASGGLGPAPLQIVYPSYYRLPLSARSPPRVA